MRAVVREIVGALRTPGLLVCKGRRSTWEAAQMEVASVNDGPFTVLLDH